MAVKPLPSWKKGLGVSLTLSIAAAISVFIYHFEEETLQSILYLRREYLCIASLLLFSLWLIEGLRIKLLVSTIGGAKISLLNAMQIYLMTFFFAAVTPFAAGEWPAHIYALNRHGLSLGEAVAVTVMRAFATRVFFTSVALFMLFYFRGLSLSPFLSKIFISAAFASFFTTLVLLLLIWKPLFLHKLLKKMSFIARNPRGKRLYTYALQELENYRVATCSLNRWKGGAVLLISLLTVCYWLCYFSIAPVLLLGLHRVVPFAQALFWQLVIQMITAYIPLPGGSGVVELGLARLYSFFVPASVLGLFVISWRFFSYYLLLFFGGLVALNKIKL